MLHSMLIVETMYFIYGNLYNVFQNFTDNFLTHGQGPDSYMLNNIIQDFFQFWKQKISLS